MSIEGTVRGHGARFGRRVRVGTILRVATVAESKDQCACIGSCGIFGYIVRFQA